MKTQAWEKSTRSTILSPILRVLALPYGFIQKLRVRLYQRGILSSHKLPVQVICVGNITVGGTGKTPAVIQLAKLLQQVGRKVVILSRGYKRTSTEKTLIISEGQGPTVSWQEAGDEPYLLASEITAPIIVGAKRYLSGKSAIENFKPDIILLDDGYQHLNLERDINLLVINAANPFGNEYLLPAGILREPLEAIQRANAVLLTKCDQARDLEALSQTIKKYKAGIPIFCSVHKPAALVNLDTDKDVGLDWLQNKKIATLSGIGDPASFSALLESLRANVVHEGCFPDHHYYQPQDLLALHQEVVKKSGAAIVTTTKDALRLPEGKKEVDNIPMLALKIELKIVDKQREWEKFWHDKCA